MQPIRARDTTRRDNTRPLLLVVMLLALGLGLIAALFGLSDKPDVTMVAVEGSRSADMIEEFSSDVADEPLEPAPTEVESDGPVVVGADEPIEAAPAVPEVTPTATPAPEPTAPSAAQAQAALADAATPTPQVESAVVDDTPPEADDPAETAATDDESDEAVVDAQTGTPDEDDGAAPEASAAAPQETAIVAAATSGERGNTPSSGTYTGSFFTRPDEDAGAVVAVNEVILTLDESGSGRLRAQLEMTDVDETVIRIDVDTEISWTTGTPQVVESVAATFVREALDAADSLSGSTVELTITNIASGTGSMCTTSCFGFTFE